MSVTLSMKQQTPTVRFGESKISSSQLTAKRAHSFFGEIYHNLNQSIEQCSVYIPDYESNLRRRGGLRTVRESRVTSLMFRRRRRRRYRPPPSLVLDYALGETARVLAPTRQQMYFAIATPFYDHPSSRFRDTT
jgi:hypothetical protein